MYIMQSVHSVDTLLCKQFKITALAMYMGLVPEAVKPTMGGDTLHFPVAFDLKTLVRNT